MNRLIPVERIEDKILLARKQKVMIDRDLAELYGVKTKALNQAVKRNQARFPRDFMFQLTKKEIDEVVTNCDHLKDLKYSYQLPFVFTEQGIAMLSSVLKSDRAILTNIVIMRAFVRIKRILSSHIEVSRKLKELEGRLDKHDSEIYGIFEAIRKMIKPEVNPKKIGFLRDQLL